jgi:PiT family inorganic phosphate transporter
VALKPNALPQTEAVARPPKLAKPSQSKRPVLGRLLVGVAFLIGLAIVAQVQAGDVAGSTLLIIAAVVGGYMAINIGANDVANNVGPAVGSGALTLAGAIAIAAIFEAAGALIAGGDVVSTVKNGIIDPALIGNADSFVWLMLAALLAGALWLNIATAFGAPVSTTHSIVGAVLGAGIAAGGWQVANWSTMGAIAASWVISPLCGGIIAAAFLYLIKRTITYQNDMRDAARKVVPLLVAVMVWAFATYVAIKGLKHVVKIEFGTAALLGLAVAVLAYTAVRPRIARRAATFGNDKSSINRLFTVPLIFAAAMLSFAHGANDVANAVGPLAAISEAIFSGAVATQAPIPLWVMVIGGLGIAVGLSLYGPRLIRTVGSEITQLDQTRGFCIAMAAAITVIVATQLGLPVSSTHIAVGAVFGVGFLREYLKTNYATMIEEIKIHYTGENQRTLDAFLARFEDAVVSEKGRMLKELKKKRRDTKLLTKEERKSLRKLYRRELVKRSLILRIVAAWLVTVPVSATLGALLYYTIRGMLLP